MDIAPSRHYLRRVRPTNFASPAPPHAQQSRPSFVFSLYAIMFLIGCYMNIPMGIFPTASALPFALIGMLTFSSRLFSREVFGIIGIALGVFALSLFAPELSNFFGNRILAFMQYLYSAVIGVTLFWAATSFQRRQVARFSEVAIIVLLIGGVIEITTGLSAFLDSTMSQFYSLGDYIDVINNRDAGIGLGFRRPKFFTSETSYYAMAYCVLVCSYALLSDKKGAQQRALLYGVLGVMLARSPIPVFSILYIGLLGVMGEPGSRGANAKRLLVAVLVAIPILVCGYLLVTFLFEARLRTIDSGDDYSFIYRTYGSLYAALAVLSEYPLSGVGIGSIDIAFGPLTSTYLSLGIPASSVFYEWRFQVQNLPSALSIYLGLFGSLFYLTTIAFYMKRTLGAIHIHTLFLLALLSTTEAAFYSPRFNIYFFVILAISRLAVTDRLPRPNRNFSG